MLSVFVTGVSGLFSALEISSHSQTHMEESPGATPVVTNSSSAEILKEFSQRPLSFEPYQDGRDTSGVKFISRGGESSVLLSSDRMALDLSTKDDRSRAAQRRAQTLRMTLAGANAQADGYGADELPGKVNYLNGNDPDGWRRDIPTFARVTYKEVYPGIDVDYYGNQRQLEYDFRLRPGADAAQIRLGFDGARRLRLNEVGDLILETAGGDVAMKKPVIYQDIDGERHEIDGAYVFRGKRGVGFRVGAYDTNHELVIDPVLSYSRVIGGDGPNVGNGIAVDASGNAYVVGTTNSTNFPVTNPFQAARAGLIDVFVMKLNPSGNVVYSTYLGGSSDDIGRGIAIDAAGNAYITGWTFSNNFPTAGPLQAARSTAPDVFMTKLNSTGSGLVYSTYLGGTGDDRAYAIAVDPANNAYITGQTFSANFPVANASQAARSGTGDVFVTKFNPAGSALTYSTYLGGSQSFEIGNGIAADPDGNAYVTGQTVSTDFPVLNAFQATKGDTFTSGSFDAFVTKFNPAGSRVFSTYIGGGFSEVASAIALDSSRNIYITGATNSTDFPTRDPLQATIDGVEDDAFVTKLNAAGTALVYSTFLGGNGDDTPTGIAVDSTGRAVVTGKTASPDFPSVRSLQSIGGGGIFQSRDGAVSWNYRNDALSHPIGISAPSQTVGGLAIDPLDSSIYAATGSGVFKSFAGVFPWQVTTQDFPAHSVAVAPRNSAIVYAGNFGRVTRSQNAGGTWTDSTIGLPSETVNSIAVDPSNDSVLYAATGIGTVGGGVYKSTDGGVTWSAVRTGLPNLGANTIIDDLGAPSTLYVGVGSTASATAGVYKTTNGGTSWTRMSNGLANNAVLGLAFDPTTSATIYAATPQGVYRTTDSGSTWTRILQTGFSVLSVAVDPRNASNLYIGTETLSGQGVFKSTDGGLNWTASGLADNRITGLAIDPFTSVITAGSNALSAADSSTDMFVSAINTAGSSLLFSSYLGGTARDESRAVGFDSSGNIFVTGSSYSTDVIAGAPDPALRTANLSGLPVPEGTSEPIRDPSKGTTGRIFGGLSTDCPPIEIIIGCSEFVAGRLLSCQIYISGGTPPYNVSVAGLPAGLRLESIAANSPQGSWFISGIPVPGTSTLTVNVTDSQACFGEETAPLSIVMEQASGLTVKKQLVGYNPQTRLAVFVVEVTNGTTLTLDRASLYDDPRNFAGGDLGTSVIAMSPTSGTAGWSCELTPRGRCTKPNLAPGETARFDVVVQVAGDFPLDSFFNLAGASGSFGGNILRGRAAVKVDLSRSPTITRFSPPSGPPATTVIVDGTDFNPPTRPEPELQAFPGLTNAPAATVVRFNGVPAAITSITDTQIVTQVPAGATSGPITVTTSGGTATSATNFIVTSATTPTATPTATPTPTPTLPPGGFEGDLAPRFAGDGQFRANDLQVMRDFFSGQAVNPAFNEFQRADSAPYETRGDGRIVASDVQQMRNFIAGLSEPQPGGGPLEPVTAPAMLRESPYGDLTKLGRRTLRIAPADAIAGDKATIYVELDGNGDEVAAGFTLKFDPERLSDPHVTLGSEAAGGAVLTMNRTRIDEGYLGVLIDSSVPIAPVSPAVLITISFEVAAISEVGWTRLEFGDRLIAPNISNTEARSLPARYADGLLQIRPSAIGRKQAHGRLECVLLRYGDPKCSSPSGLPAIARPAMWLEAD